MKRLMIDYNKMDHLLVSLLISTYPDGYGDDDIITIKKPSGEIIEAVEIRTEETNYLVKISKSLSAFMAGFEEPLEKEPDLDLDLEFGPMPDLEGNSLPDLEPEQWDGEGLDWTS